MFAYVTKAFSDAFIWLAFLGLNNMCCVYTEVMALDDTVILNKTTPHFQLLPVSKVDQP